MNKATFTLDGEGSFVGYHEPDVRWNGWACPFFPIESVREIAALTAQMAAEMPEEDFDVIEVDDDGRVFYTSRECGRVEERPCFEQAHRGQALYAIGAGGWCWSEKVANPGEDCGTYVPEGEHCGSDNEWLCPDCYGKIVCAQGSNQ